MHPHGVCQASQRPPCHFTTICGPPRPNRLDRKLNPQGANGPMIPPRPLSGIVASWRLSFGAGFRCPRRGDRLRYLVLNGEQVAGYRAGAANPPLRGCLQRDEVGALLCPCSHARLALRRAKACWSVETGQSELGLDRHYAGVDAVDLGGDAQAHTARRHGPCTRRGGGRTLEQRRPGLDVLVVLDQHIGDQWRLRQPRGELDGVPDQLGLGRQRRDEAQTDHGDGQQVQTEQD